MNATAKCSLRRNMFTFNSRWSFRRFHSSRNATKCWEIAENRRHFLIAKDNCSIVIQRMKERAQTIEQTPNVMQIKQFSVSCDGCEDKRTNERNIIIIYAFLMEQRTTESVIFRFGLSIDLYGARTHEITFECCRWRVRIELCAPWLSTPYNKCQTHNIGDSEKNPVFIFQCITPPPPSSSPSSSSSSSPRQPRLYCRRDNINTLSYLFGIETVRKPNEMRNDWAANICILCCGPMSR